jgi:hypothetical protein
VEDKEVKVDGTRVRTNNIYSDTGGKFELELDRVAIVSCKHLLNQQSDRGMFFFSPL